MKEVTPVYSVIIQNKRTMESFLKYQPFFMEAVNNGTIGVCKWNESGTSIESAVPELSDMTNDKEEWRAVIVRFEDDHGMECFESDRRNPFDFAVNAEADGSVKESEIPLIRLTHMLGGIPVPEMKFKSVQIIEEGKAPRTVYQPVEDKEQAEAHRQLSKKYEYDGKLPSSIVIISIREGYAQQDYIKTAWTSFRETKSSEFWKRNGYPSNCRFMVYDFDKQGPVQRKADEFGFWVSVLLFSMNEIDPGTLQAYRLYRLSTVFDKAGMTDAFQVLVNRLASAKYVLENEIKRDIERQIVTESSLPKYSIDITVPVKVPKDTLTKVSQKGFGLLSRGANTDLSIWNTRKKEAEERLSNSVRAAERSLDQTADKMRGLYRYTEDEVSGLDKYQIEDLSRETGKLYSEIIALQGNLPSDDISADPEIVKAEKDVRQFLRGRVRALNAFTVLGIAFALILICQVPALINYFSDKTGSLWYILATALVECLIVTGCAFVALLLQKIALGGLLHTYNTYIKAAFNKITENAVDYSTYLSNIASRSRGQSYLNLSKRKMHRVYNAHYAKYKHVRAINILVEKLKVWSTAYHLKVDYDAPSIDEDATVDTAIAPEKNPLYTFESEVAYPIPVNNSGLNIDSPLSFAKKLEIVREELYDDDIS